MKYKNIYNKRKKRDIEKLIQSNYKVEKILNKDNNYIVDYQGKAGTLYEKGTWKILIHLPKEYPYSSPSIGFINPIYHPNVDFKSGSICLNVLNHSWSPMYDLKNVFDIFLNQLLAYPNCEDPLNHEAARLMCNNIDEYNKKVLKFVKEFAFCDDEKDKVFDGFEKCFDEEVISDDDEDLSSLSDTSDVFFEEDIFL